MGCVREFVGHTLPHQFLSPPKVSLFFSLEIGQRSFRAKNQQSHLLCRRSRAFPSEFWSASDQKKDVWGYLRVPP